MPELRFQRALAGVVIALLPLVSCAGGEGNAAPVPTALEPPAGRPATTSSAAPTSTATTAAPTTTTTWGVGPDQVLVGPGGLRVDLSSCPTGWADDQGVAVDKVVLGSSAPLAGPFAPFGALPRGLRARLDELNAAGGVDGRLVELVLLDDGFDATRTTSNARELIDEHGVLALAGIPGTNQNAGVADLAGTLCVPDLVQSANAAFSAPELRPWVAGLGLSWSSEAMAILEVIAARQPGAVIAIVADDDREFGDTAVDAFAAAAPLVPAVEVLPATRVVPGATDPSPIVADVVASGATAVVVASLTPITEPLIAALHAEPGITTRAAVAGVATSRLIAVGAEAWLQVRHPDPPTTATSDVAARFLAAAAAEDVAAGELPAFWQGYTSAELVVASLLRAAALPGGLTRTNLLLAIWSLDEPHPALPGIRARSNGGVDPFLVEGGVLHQIVDYISTPVGPFDIDGRTPGCSPAPVLELC